MLLEHVKVLCEMLPCGPRDCMSLMADHDAGLRDFAKDYAAVLLMGIVEKFGATHRAEQEIPEEIVKLSMLTDDLEVVLETMNVLSDASLIDKSPHLVCQLLDKLLQDDDYFIFAFARLSSFQLDDKCTPRIDHFLQQLISLPDKIANKMKTEFPRTFELRPFSAVLMVDAIKTFHVLCKINKLEQLKVYDMRFLSKLISKVFVHFKGDKFVSTNALRLMSLVAEQEEFRESIRDVMSGLQRQAIEIVAQLAFESETKHRRLAYMFGGFWKKSSEWIFVLTKKLPLLSLRHDDRLIENLAYFLATEDASTMEKLLMELLVVWSTKSHVIDAPFEQHFYVTKLLVLMTKYLTSPKDHADNIKRQLFNGMETHIGSSDEQLKVLGMITAETVLGIIDFDAKDEDKLKFDYSDVDREIMKNVVQVIKDLPCRAVSADTLEMLEAPEDAEVVEIMDQLMSIVENRENVYSNEVKIADVKLEPSSQVETPLATPTPSQSALDSDDDDDLQAYDDPDDLPSRNDKQPKYLLDLIQAFTTKENLEDSERFELAVTSAESIIKQQLANHHTDLAVDLLRIFIGLEKMCYMEDFDELKMKIMIAICAVYPKETAQHLSQEFNTESSTYSMNKRMLMLDVLTEVAKHLSKLEKPQRSETSPATVATGQKQNKLLIKLHQELENRNKMDAQKIIRERLLAKTRKIATRTKAPDADSGVNRFAEVAGWFFFPLVHGFGRKQLVFSSGTNLKSDFDNLLLVKFLHTISVMMLCAENSLVAPKMAKEIMNLSVFLRYHEQSKIRLAVLHMVATIVLAVPRKILASQFAQDINEFVNHLSMIVKSTVVNYEPDKDCREFAKQLIGMFQETLQAE